MAKNFQESQASGLINPFSVEASRRQILAIGGLSLGALLLAGCSSPSVSAGPGQSGATPKKGGTLRVSISDGSSSDSLDPGLAVSTNTYLLATMLFDPLTKTDNNFQAQPGLATSWEVNPDATQWTVHLREGVKWHDGTDFTSKDVLYTVRRWLDPKAGSQMNGFLAPYLDVSGVSAPDPSTVVLKLKKPNSVLMQALGANPSSQIVKDGVTDFSGKNLAGTGPFKLTAWTPGGSWKVVRNDAYWGGPVYLDGLEGTITPDQGAKLQAALSGSADLTDFVPISLWATVQGRDNLTLETVKNRNTWIFAFDQRVAPFSDQRVIDAIKLATDRGKMVQTALQGHGTPVADVPVDPTSSWYPTDLKPELDPGKAKSLLADAGFPNGLDVKLSVTDSVPGMIDAAQAWQQIVKPAGINVTLDQLPADTYWTKGWMATPAFMDIWTSFFPPVAFDGFYRKGATWAETGFDDAALDKLADEILATTVPAKQVDLTKQAFLEARKTFGYLIPMFSDSAYARAANLNGVAISMATFDFRKAWLA